MIGPSGCGKTTTLRMLAGFEQPSEGKILIDDRDISRVPPNLRNISMVFQHFALFPHMNVFKNIEYGLRMRGVPREERRERVAKIMGVLEIEGLVREKPSTISGGQQQKVGLARALVTEPEILLLDEPMGSIDEALRVRTQRELRRLFERLGITFIHVTHNQLEAFAMADRIVVMDVGQVVQDDTPERLFKSPGTDFVARFVGRNNLFRGTVISASENRANIRTPLGVFAVTTDRSLPAPGETTAFSVRSDLLVMGRSDNQEGLNDFEAELALIEEVENIRIYHLTAADGTGLRAEQHGTDEATIEVGDTVNLSWSAEDAVLLQLTD
jgi:ABC-type Fe3+/spermidine/putrescine transport system ATPase subunit